MNLILIEKLIKKCKIIGLEITIFIGILKNILDIL
jgi:hypothetical protein